MSDKILVFLDDDPGRAAIHYQRISEVDQQRTFWVQTVPETIEILIRYKDRLETVSLDHDLNGETYVHSGREDCGSEIVRWLEKHDAKLYAHVKFIVHSHNEHSGPRMVERLRAAGYTSYYSPFGEGNK